MNTMSEKETVIQAINGLPEGASYDEILAEIRILAAIREAEIQSEAGAIIPHQEVADSVAKWAGV